MTRKQKEDKVKEMERFINEGVPEEAKDKDYMWEAETPIHICVIEPKQRVNEKENKKSLDAVNSKDASPVRSDDATIKLPKSNDKNEAEKSEKDAETSKKEKSAR